MTADANILYQLCLDRPLSGISRPTTPIFRASSWSGGCAISSKASTQHGGLRPFGVSFIYAGWDQQRQFQLYLSNPSGNYGGWKATSAGANNASAQSLLKQDYKGGLHPHRGVRGIAVKVLSKTMDSTKLSSEKRYVIVSFIYLYSYAIA